jgi:hypothetical protein
VGFRRGSDWKSWTTKCTLRCCINDQLRADNWGFPTGDAFRSFVSGCLSTSLRFYAVKILSLHVTRCLWRTSSQSGTLGAPSLVIQFVAEAGPVELWLFVQRWNLIQTRQSLVYSVVVASPHVARLCLTSFTASFLRCPIININKPRRRHNPRGRCPA